jgi:hypothetical protein
MARFMATRKNSSNSIKNMRRHYCLGRDEKEIEDHQTALERYAELKRDWDRRKKDHEAEEANKKAMFPELLRTIQR